MDKPIEVDQRVEWLDNLHAAAHRIDDVINELTFRARGFSITGNGIMHETLMGLVDALNEANDFLQKGTNLAVDRALQDAQGTSGLLLSAITGLIQKDFSKQED